jgi:hypothetical protein
MSLIFISYSRKDLDFVRRLADDLKGRGAPVWLDVLAIPPGKRWDDVLENALEDSSHLLLVVSKTSVRSQNVRDELAYAIDKGKQVIPLILDGTEPPLRARRFQQVIFHGRDYADGLRDLLQGCPTPPRPTPRGHPPALLAGPCWPGWRAGLAPRRAEAPQPQQPGAPRREWRASGWPTRSASTARA